MHAGAARRTSRLAAALGTTSVSLGSPRSRPLRALSSSSRPSAARICRVGEPWER